MTNSEKAYAVNQALRSVAKQYIDKCENERAVALLRIMEALQFDGDTPRALLFDAIAEQVKP